MSKIRDALEQIDLELWLDHYVEIKSTSRDEVRVRDCPKCFDDRYKLYVNVTKLVWICHHCSWGLYLNDASILLSEISGRSLFDVRKELLQTVKPTPGETFADVLNQMLVDDQEVYRLQEPEEVYLPGHVFTDGIVDGQVIKYARSRGLTDTWIRYLRMRAATKLRNYTGPWLIVPVYFHHTPVGWQGRRIRGKSEPKYVSSDEISDWVWPVEGIFLEKMREAKEVTVVEGVFDAMGAWAAGCPAVCTFGKKISTRQVGLLHRLGVDQVNLGWDPGATKEIEREAQRLSRSFQVRVVDMTTLMGSSTEKFDPGVLLTERQLRGSFADCVKSAMTLDSEAFYTWRLQNSLGTTL
jgi:hypothetical protein